MLVGFFLKTDSPFVGLVTWLVKYLAILLDSCHLVLIRLLFSCLFGYSLFRWLNGWSIEWSLISYVTHSTDSSLCGYSVFC